jgi:hypothetical protein
MAYNWIVQSTTTDATEVNANFQEVGSGSRLPTLITDTGAFNTTSVYDLGSSTYRWGTVYANNIDVSGTVSNTWNRIALSEIASATGSIEFTGLNGDTDIMYKLICRIVDGENVVLNYNMIFNGDSSGSYGYQYLAGQSTSVFALRLTSQTAMLVGSDSSNTTPSYCFSETLLYAKTGYERLALTDFLREGNGTYILQNFYLGQIWSDTSSTITSIKIYADTTTALGVGTYVELWARR